MNVLIICRELPPVGGGAGHVALNLAKTIEIFRTDATFHILTMGFGSLPPYERDGRIHIHRLNCYRKNQDSSYYREMGFFLARAVPFGRKLAKQERIDLIHAHAIVPDGLIATLIGGTGIPVVITAHGSDVPGYNPDKFDLGHKVLSPVWHRVLRKAVKVITPSNHLAGLIRENKPDQRVTLIPNGIDVSLFVEETLEHKKHEFLIVSRLVRRKNYHLFLEALREIDEPQRVNIVGDGPMLPVLKALANELNQHEIVFHGWLKNGSEEWKRLYERCGFFVFPSESENFPINLLEAMLAKMVIIASDIPGNKEVLGSNALYLKSLSASEMKVTVKQALDITELGLIAAGRHARERVLTNFSWEAVAERYIDEYRLQ